MSDEPERSNQPERQSAEETQFPPKHPLKPGEALSARAWFELNKPNKRRLNSGHGDWLNTG